MKWRGNKSLLRKKTLSIFCFLVLEPQHITFLLNLAVMYSCQLNWMSFEWSGLSEKEIETCVHLGIFPYLGSYMIEKNIYIMMKDDLASWQVYLPHQCPVPVSRLSFHKRLYFAIFAIFLDKYICKILWHSFLAHDTILELIHLWLLQSENLQSCHIVTSFRVICQLRTCWCFKYICIHHTTTTHA